MTEPGRRRWLAPGLWAAAILVGTSWPGSALPSAPSGTDKVVHVALYGVLAVLVARADRSLVARGGRLALTALALALFAALDEWHQQFVPGRSTSLADWLADLAGALLALLTLAAAWRRAPRAA